MANIVVIITQLSISFGLKLLVGHWLLDKMLQRGILWRHLWGVQIVGLSTDRSLRWLMMVLLRPTSNIFCISRM